VAEGGQAMISREHPTDLPGYRKTDTGYWRRDDFAGRTSAREKGQQATAMLNNREVTTPASNSNLRPVPLTVWQSGLMQPAGSALASELGDAGSNPAMDSTGGAHCFPKGRWSSL
jgi:hypothetical protein